MNFLFQWGKGQQLGMIRQSGQGVVWLIVSARILPGVLKLSAVSARGNQSGSSEVLPLLWGLASLPQLLFSAYRWSVRISVPGIRGVCRFRTNLPLCSQLWLGEERIDGQSLVIITATQCAGIRGATGTAAKLSACLYFIFNQKNLFRWAFS